MEIKTWKYRDCQEGLKKGKCCQECVSSGEIVCCECRVDLENKNEPSEESKR